MAPSASIAKNFQTRLRRLFGTVSWFTLVELIVVITILAILATVGFLSLSGYSDSAREAVTKANVRMVYSAILTESATSGNSPRYYVEHDPAASLSGGFVFVDGSPVSLSGGNIEVPGTNYTAGNPRWSRLKLNPDKFKVSYRSPSLPKFVSQFTDVLAAYDTGSVTVGAVDLLSPTITGKTRNTPIFQVAAISPTTNQVVISSNFTATGSTSGTTGSISTTGLIKDPNSSSSTGALADGAIPVPATPPADPYWNNVAVLLKGNGPNGSMSFVDSTGKQTWNFAGSGNRPVVSTADSKFGGSSMYFSDGMYLASNSGVPFGTGDFTIEFWAKRLSATDTSSGNKEDFFGADGWYLGGIRYGYFDNGYNFQPMSWCTATSNNCYAYGRMVTTGAPAVVFNQWQHVAVTRQGDTFRFYVDGAKKGEVVLTSTYSMDAASTIMRIGKRFVGYVDDFRVTTGVARYTGATYQVPTEEFPGLPITDPLLTQDTSVDAYPSNTVTLLNGDGTSGSSVFTDAKSNFTWSMTGAGTAPAISGSNPKFGNGSIYFQDGQYLVSSGDLALGTGDFTMEFWAYRQAGINQNTGNKEDFFGTDGRFFWGIRYGYFDNGYNLSVFSWCTATSNNCYAYGRTIVTGAPVVVFNQWQHVAITRQGNVLRTYVDGLKQSQTDMGAYSMDSGSLRLKVGKRFVGYLDDFRVTKGVARYVGDYYNLPTKAMQ